MKKRAVNEGTLDVIINMLMNSTISATPAQVLSVVKELQESEAIIEDESKENIQIRSAKGGK